MMLYKQGVALTGRNRTGPPCDVSRLHTLRPARPPPTLQATMTTNASIQKILAGVCVVYMDHGHFGPSVSGHCGPETDQYIQFGVGYFGLLSLG